MPKLSKSNSGMTLVEVIASVFIAGITGAATVSLLIGGLAGWSKGASGAYAGSSASVAAQKVAMEIREGQSASVTSGVLNVVMPQIDSDANGETCYSRDVEGVTRSYFVSSGSLKRRVGDVESTVLTRVTAASFSVAGPKVTIRITSTEQVGKETATKQADTQALLRNCKS
ncbi:MAG: hypothetical protein Q7N50_00380 [Armatimonadota bacterium]|nr:hypothetical protein [Armatimonadota bacterium]